MNKRQAQRLLRVAKALRESPNPKAFTMECYVQGDEFGGTPACALGHYAARRDLQHMFTFIKNPKRCNANSSYAKLVTYQYMKDRKNIQYNNIECDIFYVTYIQKYFGITSNDMIELFGPTGCNNAKTPIQAAKYIERFVKYHYNHPVTI